MCTYQRGQKFHYRFRLNKVEYHGVCPENKVPVIPPGAGSREIRDIKKTADAYEAEYRKKLIQDAERLRSEEENIRRQKTIVALVENYKYELTGGSPIQLEEACSLAGRKPSKRIPAAGWEQRKVTYWRDFTAFMADRFPEIKVLSDVRRAHCEEYVKHLMDHGRFIKEVTFRSGCGSRESVYTRDYAISGKTIGEIAGVCKGVFNKLFEDAGLVKNPWDMVVLPDKDSVDRDIFSPDELYKIREGISGEEKRMQAVCALGQKKGDNYDNWAEAAKFCRPLFLVAAVTGLTEGDICTLEWSEIDREKDVIYRTRRKTKVDMVIPILPNFKAYLLSLPRSGKYVFPEYAEMYLGNASGVSYRIKKFLEGLGIKTTKEIPGRIAVSVKDLHSMRHVFCYYAKRAGISPTIIQQIAGHKILRMTEHYMDHDSIQDMKEAIEKLPSFLILNGEQASPSTARQRLAELAYSLPLETVEALLARYAPNQLSA